MKKLAKKVTQARKKVTRPIKEATPREAAPVLRASQSHGANPAFAHVQAAREAMPGLDGLKREKGALMGLNLVSDDYLEAAFRAVDDIPELKAATKIDTAAERQEIAFCKAYGPLPGAAQRLADDATYLLNLKLQALTKKARAIGGWLEWKGDTEGDATAQKTYLQLKELPRGRSASAKKKSPKKKTKSSTPKANTAPVAVPPPKKVTTEKTTETVTETVE